MDFNNHFLEITDDERHFLTILLKNVSINASQPDANYVLANVQSLMAKLQPQSVEEPKIKKSKK